jgi:hypothetical protein
VTPKNGNDWREAGRRGFEPTYSEDDSVSEELIDRSGGDVLAEAEPDLRQDRCADR